MLSSGLCASLALAGLAQLAAANVRYAGVNVAGCDFGCDINGTCAGVQCPSDVAAAQMKHFVTDDNLNVFRLPVGWQYLVDNELGGSINNTFFPTYDAIVQSCLHTGAHCIVDVHNYARWNGQIIGQSGPGGPSNADFTSLWAQLAAHYKRNPRVIFGVMNEPWGVNMTQWAYTLQQVVQTIRGTGATRQMILLPGTDFTSAGAFPYVSGPFMTGIRDYDHTTRKLIFDVHAYYDRNNTGTLPECVTDQVESEFAPLAEWLRTVNRTALLSETGGGNTNSCVTYIGNAMDYVNNASDVYMGWLGWAAGSFDTEYPLSLTPEADGTDSLLMQQVIAGKFDPPVVQNL